MYLFDNIKKKRTTGQSVVSVCDLYIFVFLYLAVYMCKIYL